MCVLMHIESVFDIKGWSKYLQVGLHFGNKKQQRSEIYSVVENEIKEVIPQIIN